jgi:hypothetical protein
LITTSITIASNKQKKDQRYRCFVAGDVPLEARTMKSTYFENDDILQIRVSDKPIAREESQARHTHISYSEDGTIVEIVLLNIRGQTTNNTQLSL